MTVFSGRHRCPADPDLGIPQAGVGELDRDLRWRARSTAPAVQVRVRVRPDATGVRALSDGHRVRFAPVDAAPESSPPAGCCRNSAGTTFRRLPRRRVRANRSPWGGPDSRCCSSGRRGRLPGENFSRPGPPPCLLPEPPRGSSANASERAFRRMAKSVNRLWVEQAPEPSHPKPRASDSIPNPKPGRCAETLHASRGDRRKCWTASTPTRGRLKHGDR